MTKVSELVPDSDPTYDDLLYLVDSPGGTPASRKITIANLSKALGWVDVRAYGAKGDGVTDDSAAIQSAFDTLPSGGTIVFCGNGNSYLINTKITLPAKDLEIIGIGYPILKTASANDIFYQTNQGYMIRMKGLRFTGNGIGFHVVGVPATRDYDEYDISYCMFEQDAGTYGIYLVGAGTGRISNCRMGGGSSIIGGGIYAKQSNYRIIDKCEISGCDIGIFDDGTLDIDGYSTGTYLISSEVMNCTQGIHIKLCEDFLIANSTVDYNDTNIVIEGVDCGKIIGNYLGDRGGNPAIELKANGAINADKIIILGNNITGHYVVADTYDCIKLTDTVDTKIINNSITFYHRYGISYHGDTFLRIINNNINPRLTKGTASIYTNNDNNTVHIHNNNLGQVPSGTTSAIFSQNNGYVTEASGTALIAAGDTHVHVTHGCSFTPTTAEIQVSPVNTWGNATKWWVSDAGAVTFDINCDIDPGGVGLYFTWWVRYKVG